MRPGVARAVLAGCRYNARMASMADDVRQATQAAVLSLSVEERLTLALRLAEADVDIYCAAHGTTREDARRVFRRQRQAGRVPSLVMTGAGE